MSRVNGGIQPSEDAHPTTSHVSKAEQALVDGWLSDEPSRWDDIKKAWKKKEPMPEWLEGLPVSKEDLQEVYQRTVIDHIRNGGNTDLTVKVDVGESSKRASNTTVSTCAVRALCLGTRSVHNNV